MPKSQNQKQKLLILERIFREETDDSHGLTLAELGQKLAAYGISSERKSLYSDIETLRQVGFDILSEKRARYTVYFLAGREFEQPELYILANAVASSRSVSSGKSKELIKKLARLASKYEGKRINSQIIVSDRVKSTNEKIYYSISSVNEAIASRKQISFLYYNYDEKKRKIYHNGKKPLEVSPRALVWKDENYYVVGWYDKHGGYVNFRADKMEKVEISEQAAFWDENFDVKGYCGKLFGMFGGYSERVRIRFDNSLAGVAVDRFGLNTLFTDKGGSFELTAELEVSPVFFGWLFQFGNKAEIVAPAKVREEFKRFAEETVMQYGD